MDGALQPQDASSGLESREVTFEVDGDNHTGPAKTTPGAVKALVKPPEQVKSFDLQQITPSNQVIQTWRARQDDEEIHVKPNERFKTLSNGAPFS